ncbi:uncharacterized protein LOC132789651 [Drosophila nasuta]|uniref:uncharacterized protein LOC132789651 n=1 Tax=Drosophila nasuta TaxID=42062 RepID=UPI00295F0E79|nr:uncharacterized protein LOC132789651 [Drosophila nasuta]
MKHCLIAIIVLLSVLLREQLVSSTKGCPRRYLRRINGKCYYFSVKKMNWYGALNNCLRKGLTLADLSNPGDFNGAIDFLSSKGNTEDFWFGGNDLQTEGRYQYISNGRLVRYFGNYSVVWSDESALCNDCLEVRIRSNMTITASENCLERQYFICSEVYCDSVDAKKPRHHSHEHLHHFHHDVGEPSGESEEDMNTPSPFDSGSEETPNESNEDAIPKDELEESNENDKETTAAVSESDATSPAEGETEPTAAGETETTAAGETESTAAGETETTAGGEAESTAAGETETTAAGEAETTAAGETETTAAGEAETTAAGEAETTAAAETEATAPGEVESP